MKPITCFSLTGITILFLAVFGVKPVLAMEFRSSEKDIQILENEMIAGSLFVTGNTIQMDGAVEGDLFCAGQTVVVTGSVGGDVICAGQTIRVEGEVGGNIRTAGQTIDIEGVVDRNVTAFGQGVTLGRESVVEGDAVTGGQTVSMLGDIGKGVVGFGNSVTVDGTVGEDAVLGGNTVQLGANTNIAGKLTYESDKDAVISDAAVVGEVVRQPLRKELQKAGRPRLFMSNFFMQTGKPWPMNAVRPILVSIVFGLLLLFLFKDKTAQAVGLMKDRPLSSFGVGIAWFIIFPVLFLLFCVTIVGIPVAILYAFLFACVVLVSRLFVAIYIGKEIYSSFWRNQKENAFGVVLVGVTVAWLLFTMPYVGGLISFLAILWGTGGLVKAVLTKKPAKKPGR